VVRRQAVDVSPLRRVNQAIWLITTGARESAFRNIKTIAECLADELINAAKGSSNRCDFWVTCMGCAAGCAAGRPAGNIACGWQAPPAPDPLNRAGRDACVAGGGCKLFCHAAAALLPP
jgi:hypothetical protein